VGRKSQKIPELIGSEGVSKHDINARIGSREERDFAFKKVHYCS